MPGTVNLAKSPVAQELTVLREEPTAVILLNGSVNKLASNTYITPVVYCCSQPWPKKLLQLMKRLITDLSTESK